MTKTLVEITPVKHMCYPAGAGCPAVFKNGDGDYVLIGKRIDPAKFEELRGRVGPDEIVIEIPMELIREAIVGDQ